MSEDGRTVLVTGAAGFIGSHLCDRLLADEYRVLGLDDLSKGRISNLAEARSYGKRFRFDHTDIRDPAMLTLFERARPDVVMHLAAQSGVRPSLENPRHDAEVNILGLINLLECAAATGTKKIVFAASGGTLYGEPRRVPLKETSRAGAHPTSPYGISKKVAEDYLRFYERYRGVSFTALALANVYGPRQDPHGEAGVISIFVASMLGGEAPRINGDGNQTRDYVYVEDVVHAFALAADRGDGKVMNVGTGLETSVNHLYRLIAEATGFEGQPEHGPLPAGDLRRSALDPSLAEAEIGWKPWTQLQDGLSATIEALSSAT